MYPCICAVQKQTVIKMKSVIGTFHEFKNNSSGNNLIKTIKPLPSVFAAQVLEHSFRPWECESMKYKL